MSLIERFGTAALAVVPGYANQPLVEWFPDGMGSLSLSARQRQSEIVAARAAYEGSMDYALDEDRDGSVTDSVRIPWARRIVDANIAWALGSGEITVRLLDSDGNPDEAATADFNRRWPRERLLFYLQKAMIRGGYGGHMFVRVMPDPDDSRKARWINWDPESVDVQLDPEDNERVLRFIRHWKSTDAKGNITKHRQTHERINERGQTRWRIYDEAASENGKFSLVEGSAETVDRCQVKEVPNFPSAEFWGMSDLEQDLIGPAGLLRAIERVASNSARAIRFFGHPRLLTKMLGPEGQDAVEDADIGATIHLDTAEGTAEYLEISGAGLAAANELLDRFTRYTHEQTGLPDLNDSAGDGSGAQLRWRHATWLVRMEIKRRLQGGLLSEVIKEIEQIEHRKVWEFVDVTFPALVEIDHKDEVAAIAAEHALVGLKREVLAEKLGYDPKLHLEDEQAEAALGPDGQPLPAQSGASEAEVQARLRTLLGDDEDEDQPEAA